MTRSSSLLNILSQTPADAQREERYDWRSGDAWITKGEKEIYDRSEEGTY